VDGKLLAGNEQRVAQVAALARDLGRPLVTATSARELFLSATRA
jgi:uncharacterized protein (DUF849 family)